jgi:hypothetical protein
MAIVINGSGTITGLSAGGLPDDSVATADIADNAITLAKMFGGVDGNIISYDASGDPVAVVTGSSGQVLTSAGAGAPPTFAAAAGGAEVFIGTTNFAASVTGALAITGVGFQPDTILMQGAMVSEPSHSNGAYTDAGGGIVMMKQDYHADSQWTATAGGQIYYLYDGGTSQDAYGTIASLDSDGFTITRSKSSSPTATIFLIYTCFKNA